MYFIRWMILVFLVSVFKINDEMIEICWWQNVQLFIIIIWSNNRSKTVTSVILAQYLSPFYLTNIVYDIYTKEICWYLTYRSFIAWPICAWNWMSNSNIYKTFKNIRIYIVCFERIYYVLSVWIDQFSTTISKSF